jgi:two-component system, NarL family, nitrate/nitrite response regulator NarL
VQSGASAFIHKSKAASEAVTAIRDVARRRMLITPRTIATLIARRRAIEAQFESLTPREKEVLRLMADGLSSRAVAAKMGISYTAVRTHIRSLDSKLGVHSKLEANVKARELGLLNERIAIRLPRPCGAETAALSSRDAVDRSGRRSIGLAEPRASSPSG